VPATADFHQDDERLALATPTAYLLVTATASDVASLAAVSKADWSARGSLQVGRALGHPVFWCVGERPDEVDVLVGQDDETWELALTVPLAVVLEAVRQASC
jgi:hypothetical protein